MGHCGVKRRHDFTLAGPENGRFLLGSSTSRGCQESSRRIFFLWASEITVNDTNIHAVFSFKKTVNELYLTENYLPRLVKWNWMLAG